MSSSIPPSRSSSYYQQPSRTNTPLYGSATPTQSSQLPPSPKQEHTTKLSHKLRHMFDSAKSANFQATVIIHELGNVPQLAGEFAVGWKFRGRRPKGKDAVAGHGSMAKPSLPNLKLNQPLSTIHPSPSSSSLSIRTSSTASTTSPIVPMHPPSLRSVNSTAGASRPPQKSLSMPPQNLTPLVTSRVPSASTLKGMDHRGPTKKASDPTPLRQSMAPPPVTLQMASPELLSTPGDSPEAFQTPDGGHIDLGSDSGGSDNSTRALPLPSNDPSSTSLLPPPAIGLQPPSAASSSSRLTVPSPRVPARSGTNPSVSTILDPIPGKGDEHLPRPRPVSLSRTPSYATGSTSMTQTSSSNSIQPSINGNPIRRHRSTSGPYPGAKTPPSSSSSNRKGQTPTRSLKQHTCTWDYEVVHTLRIPLGKSASTPTPAPGGTTPPRRTGPPAPMLGAGPLSESGLRMEIVQYPTPAAMNAGAASGANKDSLPSMLAAAHHAQHTDKQGNPSEKGASGAESNKTLFGIVDIDLAAFAGKGRLTRRFLLKGSRTNATIKLTVDLKWLGGEERWTAPPMHEGHHVTGMHDLVSNETEDRLKGDLNLAKTPSNSSSSSSILSGLTHSNPSMASSLNLSRNVSNVSLTGPTPQLGYKSFEHHLRPTPRPTRTPEEHSKYDPNSFTASLMHRHSHHRHHHHSRHIRGMPSIPKYAQHELPPEVVIEAVFNPHASTEESPFTFVPPENREGLEGPQAILQNVLLTAGLDEDQSIREGEDANVTESEGGLNVGGNGKGGGGKERSHWWARKNGKDKGGQRAVSAAQTVT